MFQLFIPARFFPAQDEFFLLFVNHCKPEKSRMDEFIAVIADKFAAFSEILRPIRLFTFKCLFPAGRSSAARR